MKLFNAIAGQLAEGKGVLRAEPKGYGTEGATIERFYPPGGTTPEMLDIPLIDIQDAAEYVLCNDDHGFWGLEDFPNIAPPWPVFWMEFRMPPQIYGAKVAGEKTRFIAPSRAGGRYGALVTSIIPDGGVGWELVVELCRTIDGTGEPLIGVSGYRIDVGADGSPGKGLFGYSPFFDAAGVQGLVGALLFPVLSAISFCHCKNITIQAASRPRHERRQDARNNVPEVRWSTLVIDPTRAAVRSSRTGDREELRRALHMCRGHFATYGPDRPLFGKYTGTVWVPQHVRGRRELGERRHDYQVRSRRSPVDGGATSG